MQKSELIVGIIHLYQQMHTWTHTHTQTHTYTNTHKHIYITNAPTYFGASASSSGSFVIAFFKVIKLLKCIKQ
jgi:hypothetical protein